MRARDPFWDGLLLGLALGLPIGGIIIGLLL